MTWQILNVEPAYAVCDQCKSHKCGIVDGEHKWIRTSALDTYGDPVIIGYNCVKMWAENLGIGKEVVTWEVVREPNADEINAWMAIRIAQLAEVTSDGVGDHADGGAGEPPVRDVDQVGQQTGGRARRTRANQSQAT